jgi:hypothetical protein
MDDPVTDGDGLDLPRLAQARSRRMQGGGNVLDLLRRIGLVDQRLLIRPFGAQPRPSTDAIHLSLDQALGLAVSVDCEHLEFDAR